MHGSYSCGSEAALSALYVGAKLLSTLLWPAGDPSPPMRRHLAKIASMEETVKTVLKQEFEESQISQAEMEVRKA